MPFPNIDPVAFAIGPVVVRWYALAYLAGVALGVLYAMMLLRRKTLWKDNSPPFGTDSLWDFAFWAVVSVVVGGRLGYVLFYNLPYYIENPLGIFALWEGGMSFHGGMIAMVISMIVFTRSQRGNILCGLDILAACAPIGLFLGRLANFINSELWGDVTTLPWGVVFPTGGDLPRHPSQLYEAALEGLLLFIVLRIVTHVFYGLRRPGLVAGVFAIWYGLSRILVEQVRVPDPQLGYLFGGWLTMGIVLTLPLVLVGIVLVVMSNRMVRGR